MERRNFIKAAFLGGASTYLIGCAGGDDNSQTQTETEPQVADLACDDVSALTEAEVQARTNLNYVDVSPKPGEYCNNCSFWVEGESATSCGGCTVIKGPIAPKGYCITWAAKAS